MSKVNLFLDSSVLFAGIASPTGAARVLLILGEAGRIRLAISEQVIAETERAIARKLPKSLSDVREAIRTSVTQVIPDPSPAEVKAHLDWLAHPPDVPVLLATMKAKADYLVTFNRKHFIDDPKVAERSDLRIGTPEEALKWVREQWKR